MSSAGDDRLSRIDTAWSVVRNAHSSSPNRAKEAQQELLARYRGAIRRYLLAALRNEEAAHDVFQEFALRFVRGDFHTATPERGKFRSFVKRILSNLIVDHQRARVRANATRPLPDERGVAGTPDEDQLDRELVNGWRDEVFARCWALMADNERLTGRPFYTVLRLRVDNENLRSDELAEKLNSQTGKQLSVGASRVLLHRARTMFSDLLIDEVTQSLETGSPEEIEAELIELDLLDYCRAALQRRSREREKLAE